MNSVEEKLWAYIDGTCSDEERRAIEHLIETDDIYRRKFDELMAFDAELSAIEADEPPMAFTYNVMEAVRAEHARNPLKSAINPRIIKAIGIFFILTITAVVFFAFSQVQWSAGNSGLKLSTDFKMPNIKNHISGDVVKGFLFFDVVLGLFLFDALLRRKNAPKQA